MTNGGTKIGEFALALTAFRTGDGDLEYGIKSVNKGIPIEIVIMQLRAHLRGIERRYFDEFDKAAR